MRAVCTWGEGPDILIVLEGKPVMLYEIPTDLDKVTYGFVRQGSFEFSISEAIMFGHSLEIAIQQAIELENGWIEAGKKK